MAENSSNKYGQSYKPIDSRSWAYPKQNKLNETYAKKLHN